MMPPSASIGGSASAARRPFISKSSREPSGFPSPICHRCGVNVTQAVFHHTFPNGLTLLAERMEHVRSAALNFLVPAGCVYDPPRQPGVASILAEMITRGAGKRDSRKLALALDNLGLDRDEGVGSMHVRFWGEVVQSQGQLAAIALARPP